MMKVLLYSLLPFSCCMGMERQVIVAPTESTPIVINVPASPDSHRIEIYDDHSSQVSQVQRKVVHAQVETVHNVTPESNSSTDSVSKRQHIRWLAITNAITGTLTALIGAAVTLAVQLNNKCPNGTTPPGTGKP